MWIHPASLSLLLLILAGNDDIGLKGSRQSELKAVSRLPPPSWDQRLRADLKLSEGPVILHLVRGGVENRTKTHSKCGVKTVTPGLISPI